MTSRSFSGEVEQVVEGTERVSLWKEIWQLDSTPPLTMVRKHALGGPTRPPVLLVHGFAQNRYSWHTSRRSPSAWLARAGFDVWNLELRGHGRSRGESGSQVARFGDYIDDVERALALLPDRAFWIGHSLGGTALYGAASRGLPTRGVVGIGAIYGFGGANRAIGLLARATGWLSGVPGAGAPEIRTQLAGRLLGKLYGLSDPLGYANPLAGWYPGSIEPELLAERLETGFDWTSARVWMEMSRWGVAGTIDFDEAWSRSDVPLLVVLGDEDQLVPPADGRLAYDRSGSRDKTLAVLDAWSHGVHWGHLDLVLGRDSLRVVWSLVHDWMAARTGMITPP